MRHATVHRTDANSSCVALFAICLLLVVTLPEKTAALDDLAELHPWEVFEVEMTAERELSSPYVEGLPEGGDGYVRVTFQCESREAQGQQLTVTGFWDGDQTWRARFAPPAPGEWSYCSFMAKFLRTVDWWVLEPHPELVHQNPSRYCAAVPGREYVVYLRWGGVVRLDLRPSSPEQRFEFRWIDLVEEKVRRTGEVGGGETCAFRPPEDYPGVEHYKDWVLHVKRK